MSAAFAAEPHPKDVRGGSITISRIPDDPSSAGDACGLHITVSFRPDPKDDAEHAVCGPLAPQQEMQFGYIVESFNYVPVMTRLAKAVESLHNAYDSGFQKAGAAYVKSDGELDLEKRAEALRPLAMLGYDLFTKLFQLDVKRDGTTSGYRSHDVPTKQFGPRGRLLRRWLQKDEELHIIAPRDIVPWPVLYPEDVEGQAVDEKKFWAFSKKMQLLHEGLAHGVELDPPWHLAAAVDKNDQKLAAGALVHEEAGHPFVQLATRIKNSKFPRELFEAFAQAEMLYHYGHASASSRGFEFGQIQLNGATLDAAGLETLLKTKIDLPDREPLLVFLNGCSTGIGAGDGETIPEVLVRHALGRLCFVTTVGAVPPWAAAMFAQHFFCAYLGGAGATQSLGESLAHARREMLEKHGNPVGLLYVAYGNTATAIKSSATAAPT